MKASAPLDMELVGELRDIMAEGFAALVESYERDSGQRLVAMQQALSSDDRSSLRQLAHSLKGSSSNLGALEVTELCIALERGVADIGQNELGALLDALAQAHVRALAALYALVA
jgi:histidine phosphotransfer protein HptB